MAESLGLFGAVKGLFEYNRENFIFDRTLNQERVYQIQKMRVAQVKLYRDDLRELFDLTIRKMDSYLIFNALLLLFTGGLFYEGRLPLGTPAWLLWLWTMSLGSAFFFLSLAIWFAIHASITAQTFQVRLLTQWLRLPVPSAQDIHAVSGAATDFEEARVKDMLRVPGLANKRDQFNCTEQFPDVPNDLLKSDLVEDYTLFVEHFYLFRDLQKHWQGFDAYARIGMVVGTNMLLSAFSYTSLAYYLMSFMNWGGLVFPFVLTGFQLIHIKINLRDVTRAELASIVVLVVLPVLLASIAGVQSVLQKTTFFGDILSPVIFACCGCWVIFLVLLGSEDDGGLPCRFITVSSIDVLGMDEDEARFAPMSPVVRRDSVDSEIVSLGAEMRDGSETPVALAVPPAATIRKAEERRRSRSSALVEQEGEASQATSDHDLPSNASFSLPDAKTVASTNALVSDIKFYPQLGAVEEEVNDEIPLDEIMRMTMNKAAGPASINSSLSSGNLSQDAAEGIAAAEQNVTEKVQAYDSSMKARMLPWKTFREAGAVLVCLWIFATAYSVLASFQPRWGWPQTLPHGDGEAEESGSVRRLIQHVDQGAVYATHDQATDPFKVSIWEQPDGELLKSIDVVDFERMYFDNSGDLVVIERSGVYTYSPLS